MEPDLAGWASVAATGLLAAELGILIWLDRRKAPRFRTGLKLGQSEGGRYFADYFLMNNGPLPAKAIRTGLTFLPLHGETILKLIPVGEQVMGDKSLEGKLHSVENLGQGQYHLYGEVTDILLKRVSGFFTVVAVGEDVRKEWGFVLTFAGNTPRVRRASWRRSPFSQLRWHRRSRAAARTILKDYA